MPYVYNFICLFTVHVMTDVQVHRPAGKSENCSILVLHSDVYIPEKVAYLYITFSREVCKKNCNMNSSWSGQLQQNLTWYRPERDLKCRHVQK